MTLANDLVRIVSKAYPQNLIPPELEHWIRQPQQSLTPAAARKITQAYRSLLTGGKNSEEVWPDLRTTLSEAPPAGISRARWAKAQVQALRTHDVPSSPSSDFWKTQEYFPDEALALNTLLWNIQTSSTHRDSPVVVFDLDDTLLATRPRELKIYHEYGRLHQIPRLLKMEMGHIVGWDLNHLLVDLMKFDPEWARVHIPQLRAFWNTRFFSNEYLAEDPTFQDAALFVNTAHQKGASIVYVTGRDQIDMREGTIESLKKTGFPSLLFRTSTRLFHVNHNKSYFS